MGCRNSQTHLKRKGVRKDVSLRILSRGDFEVAFRKEAREQVILGLLDTLAVTLRLPA